MIQNATQEVKKEEHKKEVKKKKKPEKRITNSKAFLIGVLEEDNGRDNIPKGNSRIMNDVNHQGPEILQAKQYEYF